MPRKLIVCADGTWNTADETDHGTPCPTNVRKIATALLPADRAGTPQVVHYHAGVGTNFGQQLTGGAFGAGLFENVRECYRFLIQNYEPGDRLHFFGFSRGAYTVRSLTGLIRCCGILRRGHEGQEDAAVAHYRSYDEDTAPDSPRMRAFRKEHAHHDEQEIEVIGVWDTVGAMGIPGLDGRFRLMHGLDWQFHDVKLSSYVKNAFHALAIHEHRKEFVPALWEQTESGAAKGQCLEQMWFTGSHSDVGGGYAEAGLSDVALMWMIEKVKACGLEFDEAGVGKITANALANAHDSFSVLYKVLAVLGHSTSGVWRELGPTQAKARWEDVHPTAVERFRTPNIKPGFWPETFRSALSAMPWAPQATGPPPAGGLPSA